MPPPTPSETPSSSSSKPSTQQSSEPRSYPSAATLTIGYSSMSQSFTSKIFCVPSMNIVEAIAGSEGSTTLPPDALKPFLPASSTASSAREIYDALAPSEDEIFKSLRTRWTFREFPYKPSPPNGEKPQEGNASHRARARTEVGLSIDCEFRNPMLAAMSQAAAPKVAGLLIDAFENRVKELLGEGDIINQDQGKTAESTA
ncbi:hypothetical protein MMC25_004784 [Agyrium rufum]|nr:hypothetical protein [Agyrium rufum]